MTRWFKRLAQTATFSTLFFASIPDAFADDLTGQASIVDGVTLEIHRTRIRLWGIDAPEMSAKVVIHCNMGVHTAKAI
jgi:endonuclease YncB( thermonuclease family)